MSAGLILMTIAIVQFGAIPLVVDLNASHATNSEWPPHARFHVVTQVLTTSAFSALALYFLWGLRGDPAIGVCIATAIGLTVLVGFLASASATRFYGGAVSLRQGLAGMRFGRIDGNVANFGLALLLLLAGRLLLA